MFSSFPLDFRVNHYIYYIQNLTFFNHFFKLFFYFSEIVQTPEAELALLGENINNALREAIDKLPERCREVFVLSKIEELSNKEIAERLNISVKTVEVQMTKALSRLRKELEWLLSLIFFVNF